MKVYRQSETPIPHLDASVCTIGNFDGVHLGHQQILSRLAEAKKIFGVPSVVYTFEPHPVRLLNPKKNLKLILTYEQRLNLLERYKPDIVIVAKFTMELAKTPAALFVREVLVDTLHVKKVVVGYDFNFGHGGDGSAQHLALLGEEMGFEAEQVPAVEQNCRVVSSSRIRRLIAAGEMDMVRGMLGRPFFLVGTVVKGFVRGQKMGFPTANLSTQQEIIPAKGVYAALVKTSHGIFKSAVNVGCNPTFDNGVLSVEAHLLDFDGDLYAQPLEVHFVRRIRDEMRFDSVDRLKQQIQKDTQLARRITKDIDPEIMNL